MRWPLCFLLIQIAITTYGQKVLPIHWQQCYGDAGTDIGYEILQTSDHSFLVIGNSTSSSNGGNSAFVIKLTPEGTVAWQQRYYGNGKNVILSVVESRDGFYYLAGTTNSTDGPQASNHGSWDVWVIKLHKDGDLIWQDCYGGSAEDAAQTITEDSIGNILVGAMTNSTNGDVTGKHGVQDVWILKLDPDGKVLWQKCYGGSLTDGYYSFGVKGGVTLAPTYDGGFVFAALTISKDWDLEARKDRGTDWDLWVVKVAANDSTLWSTVIGGELNEWPNSIIETRDSGLMIAGSMLSDLLSLDGFAVKLNKGGGTEWQRSFGKKDADQLFSVVETDEGYMFAGTTIVDTLGQHFGDEAWILSVDGNGTLTDEKIFGGSSRDVASDIIRCDNGGYRFIGYTFSEDGDLFGYHKTFETLSDIWIAEFGLTHSGVLTPKDLPIRVFPNPTSGFAQTVVELSAPSRIQYELVDLHGNHIVSSGNLWYEAGKQSLTMDLSAYPAGSYRFRLSIDGVPFANTIQLVK